MKTITMFFETIQMCFLVLQDLVKASSACAEMIREAAESAKAQQAAEQAKELKAATRPKAATRAPSK